MEQIKHCTEELVEAVRECDAYKNFAEAREELKKNPKLWEVVQDFRKKNYEMQNLKENVDLYTEMEHLEEEYHEIRKNTVIRRYLTSELELCRIMQRINLNLIQVVDLDIVDFEDIIRW